MVMTMMNEVIGMDFYAAVGEELKKAREKSERSGSWVARQAGISTSTYRLYEMGQVAAPMGKIEDVCKVLGVPFGDLLRAVADKME
jgi:transcriptional regulator with XRE-family HTH domain